MKVGRILKNRYKLLDKVGYGGMATVYIALDIQLGRTAAIKIMNENLANDPNYIKRFKR